MDHTRAPSRVGFQSALNRAKLSQTPRDRGGAKRGHTQSVVPARRVADRDDHDREPAIRLDAVRGADAVGHGLAAIRHSGGVCLVHCVPNLGAAVQRLARGIASSLAFSSEA